MVIDGGEGIVKVWLNCKADTAADVAERRVTYRIWPGDK